MSKEVSKRKLCNQPPLIAQKFDPGVSQIRMNFILTTNKKWMNGTEIKFMFVEGPEPQKNVVRQAFSQWKNLGIGISFSEVNNVDDSMVRIGFDLTDGSWSYVGRDILTIPKTQKTMNFGWDLTADSYGMTTALHEIGHTLGYQHEHQSPLAGIVWNVQAVYDEFSGPPNNWPKSQIDSNIIDKLPADEVQGSSWDPTSIMEYEFGPGLVLQPAQYSNGIFPPGVLSQLDISGIKALYPGGPATMASLEVLKSVIINAKSGEQSDLVFKAPATRKYTFQIVGQLDAVMVISEKTASGNHYLSGDDDSGTDKNAKVTLPLIQGREYLVNVRVLFAGNQQSGSLIVS